MGNTYTFPGDPMPKLHPILDNVQDFVDEFRAKTLSMTEDFTANRIVSYGYSVECTYMASRRAYEVKVVGPLNRVYRFRSSYTQECVAEISAMISRDFLDQHAEIKAVGMPYQLLRRFCNDIRNDLGEEILANRARPLGSGYHVQYSYVDATDEHRLDVWHNDNGYQTMYKGKHWDDTELSMRHRFRKHLKGTRVTATEFDDMDLSWMGEVK